jgi:hypothetical protein
VHLASRAYQVESSDDAADKQGVESAALGAETAEECAGTADTADTTLSHPDLRANPNARIHVRRDQVTHMHRLSEYQNTV